MEVFPTWPRSSKRRRSTIIIEHRLEDVLYRPVDRILLVNDGTLLFNGSPDELLSSALLLENGIREPLYVTVLRQLGFDTRSAQNLSQLDALDLSDLALPDRVLKDKRDSSSDSILKVEGLSVSYGDNPTIIEGSCAIPLPTRFSTTSWSLSM